MWVYSCVGVFPRYGSLPSPTYYRSTHTHLLDLRLELGCLLLAGVERLLQVRGLGDGNLRRKSVGGCNVLVNAAGVAVQVQSA